MSTVEAAPTRVAAHSIFQCPPSSKRRIERENDDDCFTAQADLPVVPAADPSTAAASSQTLPPPPPPPPPPSIDPTLHSRACNPLPAPNLERLVRKCINRMCTSRKSIDATAQKIPAISDKLAKNEFPTFLSKKYVKLSAESTNIECTNYLENNGRMHNPNWTRPPNSNRMQLMILNILLNV
eukprot:scpid70738/ scgid16913/ 